MPDQCKEHNTLTLSCNTKSRVEKQIAAVDSISKDESIDSKQSITIESVDEDEVEYAESLTPTTQTHVYQIF